MKKSLSILLILVMLLGMLTACAQTTAPAETTETKTETTEPASETTETDATEAEIEAAAEDAEQEAEETDQLYIAAVAAEVGIPYFTTMQWGAMDAAKDYNVELYWTGPAEWDFSKQQTFIDGVMATNPDALMLVPTDNSALVTYVDTWMKEGTPVICTDLFLMEPVDLVGYSSDPYSGGAEAAEIFFEQNGEGGVYQPVGTNPGAYGANLRVQGFVETMQSLDPSCKILDTLYPSNDANKAAQLVSAALTGNPDMSGVFCAVSACAAGAASAIIEAGKSGVVKIASFDADPQQVLDLKAGTYDVLIAQDPYQMGYDAIMNLAKYVRGELTDADFTEKQVRYPMCALTRDNVDDPAYKQYKYIAELSEVGY